ncbi:hypothetical protein [Arthrobacter sp. HLT1-20]
MSPAGPQQSEPTPGNSAARALGKLRKLPGFTAAAVAFLLIVLLGAGGAAVAKWNQSATATIAITAGAAPVPSPTPTPSLTPSPTPSATPPPNTQGNIVANPVIAARPGTVSASKILCSSQGASGNFTFDWSRDTAAATSYNVSLKSRAPSTVFKETQTVTSKTAIFELGNNQNAFGYYVLRVQPMNGSIAGDPSYRTLRYTGKQNWGCEHGTAEAQPPLGAFSVTAVAAAQPVNTNDNKVGLTWAAAAQASSYVVSIKSTTASSSYGAEFSTSGLGATLTFPARVLEGGQPASSAPFYGEYLLRVIPMNGLQAGDPVYKKILYQAWNTTIWDYQMPQT